MNKELFLKIVDDLGEGDLGDFTFEVDSKIYRFIESDSGWVDGGKYQENDFYGVLIEVDEDRKELERFNLGVSRWASRCGSHNNHWEIRYGKYVAQRLVEVIIPEHKDIKWVGIDEEE
jgi:hypothetical protein